MHQERAQESEPLFQWKYRLPLFLAITIGMFNQLAGINAILYYMNDIFAAAGYSQISGDQQAIAIGAMNLVFTLVGMSLIDKLGRKTLLLIGSVGTALAWPAWRGFSTRKPTKISSVAAGHLHRVLRHLAGRGDLGLHRRGLSEPGAVEGPGAGKLVALDYERIDRLHFRRWPHRRALTRSCFSRR